MSGFNLPLPGNPVRDLLGDISEVAKILAPENRHKILNLDDAFDSVSEYLRSEEAAKSVYQIVRSMSDPDKYLFYEFRRENNCTLGAYFLWEF